MDRRHFLSGVAVGAGAAAIARWTPAPVDADTCDTTTTAPTTTSTTTTTTPPTGGPLTATLQLPIRNASLYRSPDGTHSVHLYSPATPNGQLVIYHHGTGEDDESPVSALPLASVTAALLDAGYHVAADQAHGTAWGNDKALQDYADTYAWVLAQGVAPTATKFLAASMGGISALLCIAQARIPNVTHFAGIYPATNLAACYNISSLKSAINNAYGGAAAYPVNSVGHDPMLYDPAVYTGVRFRCWASTGDTTVKKVDNADAFSALVAPVTAEASVVACTGNHGDPSHYQPADVVAFFAR